MKKIKLARTAFITLLTASILVTGCKKDATDTVSQEEILELQMTTEATAEADVLFNDVFDNVMGVDSEVGLGAGIGIFRPANNDDGVAYVGRTDSGAQRCFIVTVTPQQPGVFPKTVEIDFGNGCLGRDGRMRRGKIITVYTGRLVMPGSKSSTTFSNYFVDSTKVEGMHSVENVSTSNNRSFTVKVVNGKLTKPNGHYTLLNKTKTWVQTEGNGTPNMPADDVFSITGNASGTIARGTVSHQWSTNIIEPIIRKFTCRWPVKGKKEVTRNNRTGVLDFGNGTCDNQATFTVNGNVRNITLR